MTLGVGDLAPDFRVCDPESDQCVALSDYEGHPVVLAFYPVTFRFFPDVGG
jgi:peroxiredoxin